MRVFLLLEYSFIGALGWQNSNIINYLKQNAMKEVTFEKATEMALIGALATIEVTEDLCGKEFTDALVRQVSPLNFVDRLTFWNLINVSMNSNKSTHIFYGPKAFHPDMLALVSKVCEMMLKQFKK